MPAPIVMHPLSSHVSRDFSPVWLLFNMIISAIAMKMTLTATGSHHDTRVMEYKAIVPPVSAIINNIAMIRIAVIKQWAIQRCNFKYKSMQFLLKKLN